MISVLISNLKIMGILALLFCGSFGANTLLGLYYNIGLIKETFSAGKFWQGLAKGGVVLLAGLFITLIISILPFGLTEMGIVLDEVLLEGINITAICGVIVSSIIRYLKDALTKFYAIMSHKEKEEEIIEEDEPLE